MTEPTKLSDEERDRREQRLMYIFSAVVVILIGGASGIHWLYHKDQPAASDNTEISSQSRVAPER
jgi:hypothetical protein